MQDEMMTASTYITTAAIVSTDITTTTTMTTTAFTITTMTTATTPKAPLNTSIPTPPIHLHGRQAPDITNPVITVAVSAVHPP